MVYLSPVLAKKFKKILHLYQSAFRAAPRRGVTTAERGGSCIRARADACIVEL